MARSDLLIELVRSGAAGDAEVFRRVVQTVIADEKAKRHDVLAERLQEAISAKSGHGTLGASAHGSTGSGSTGSASVGGPDGVRETWPSRTLEDLVLPDDLRSQVELFVEEQLRSDELRASGLEPSGRAVLVGPPGCGKTSIAEAIANQLAVPLYTVRYESLMSSYLGDTARRLASVFDLARRDRCVLFFDELDAIGKERSDSHDLGEMKRIVTSLLALLDDAPSYSPVLAATNHPELIDSAAWRRFSTRFDVPNPSRPMLVRFFDLWRSNHEPDLGLASSTLAKAMAGGSYAEAENLALAIARRVVLDGQAANPRAIAQQQITRHKTHGNKASPG